MTEELRDLIARLDKEAAVHRVQVEETLRGLLKEFGSIQEFVRDGGNGHAPLLQRMLTVESEMKGLRKAFEEFKKQRVPVTFRGERGKIAAVVIAITAVTQGILELLRLLTGT